jgi:membrane-anchored protein YejM (alkaline phosphatase superfamily)
VPKGKKMYSLLPFFIPFEAERKKEKKRERLTANVRTVMDVWPVSYIVEYAIYIYATSVMYSSINPLSFLR